MYAQHSVDIVLLCVVCETIHEEHEVEEDVPNCETVLEEQCAEDKFGQEWCDQVPRRECTLETQTSTKVTPKTECRKEAAEVCGPEVCPIVKGERRCRSEVKTVRRESCNLYLPTSKKNVAYPSNRLSKKCLRRRAQWFLESCAKKCQR